MDKNSKPHGIQLGKAEVGKNSVPALEVSARRRSARNSWFSEYMRFNSLRVDFVMWKAAGGMSTILQPDSRLFLVVGYSFEKFQELLEMSERCCFLSYDRNNLISYIGSSISLPFDARSSRSAAIAIRLYQRSSSNSGVLASTTLPLGSELENLKEYAAEDFYQLHSEESKALIASIELTATPCTKIGIAQARRSELAEPVPVSEVELATELPPQIELSENTKFLEVPKREEKNKQSEKVTEAMKSAKPPPKVLRKDTIPMREARLATKVREALVEPNTMKDFYRISETQNEFEKLDISSPVDVALKYINIPLFSKQDALMKSQRKIGSTAEVSHSRKSWMTLFNWQLDKCILRHKNAVEGRNGLAYSNNPLKDEILQLCCLTSLTTSFDRIASQFAVELIEGEIFSSLEGPYKQSAVARTKNDVNNSTFCRNWTPDTSKKPVEPLFFNGEEPPKKITFKAVPDESFLSTYKLFQNDKIYVSHLDFGVGEVMGILVIGDAAVSMNTATKRYANEVKAQSLLNSAIVRCKMDSKVKGNAVDEALLTEPYSILCANLITCVNYKGYMLVVMPLPKYPFCNLIDEAMYPPKLEQELEFVEKHLNKAEEANPYLSEADVLQHFTDASIRITLYKVNQMAEKCIWMKQRTETEAISGDKEFSFISPTTFLSNFNEVCTSRDAYLQRVRTELESIPFFTPIDTITLSDFMRKKGVHIRFLSQFSSRSRSAWLEHLIQVDIIARTLKHVLRDAIRIIVNKRSYLKPLEEFCKGISKRTAEKSRFREVVYNSKKLDEFEYSVYDERSGVSVEDLQLSRGIEQKLLQLDSGVLHSDKLTIIDVIGLNFFNLVLGSSLVSEEFWTDYLALKCEHRFGIDHQSIKQSSISLPALYISMQLHCGLEFFLCPVSFYHRIKNKASEPLKLNEIKAWVPRVSSATRRIYQSLPTWLYISIPKEIPLKSANRTSHKTSNSTSQILLSKAIKLTIAFFADTNWTLSKTFNSAPGYVPSNLFKNTFQNNGVGAQKDWMIPEALRAIATNAIQNCRWKIATRFAEESLKYYPEGHAASIPARLLLCLIRSRGAASPAYSVSHTKTFNVISEIAGCQWLGFHPIMLDLDTIKAWIEYVQRNYTKSTAALYRAIQSSILLSADMETTANHTNAFPLNILNKSKGTRTFIVNERIAPAPLPTLRMARLLALLGSSLIQQILQNYDSSTSEKDAYVVENPLGLAEEAISMNEFALKTYDSFLGPKSLQYASCAAQLALALVIYSDLCKAEDSKSAALKAVMLGKRSLDVRMKLLTTAHNDTISSGFLLAMILGRLCCYEGCVKLLETVYLKLLLKSNRFGPSKPQKFLDISRFYWFLEDVPFFNSTFIMDDEPTLLLPTSIEANLSLLDASYHGLQWVKERIFLIYINQSISKEVAYDITSLFLMLERLEKNVNRTGLYRRDKYLNFSMLNAERGEEHAFLSRVKLYPIRLKKELLIDPSTDSNWINCLKGQTDNEAISGCEIYFKHLIRAAKDAITEAKLIYFDKELDGKRKLEKKERALSQTRLNLFAYLKFQSLLESKKLDTAKAVQDGQTLSGEKSDKPDTPKGGERKKEKPVNTQVEEMQTYVNFYREAFQPHKKEGVDDKIAAMMLSGDGSVLSESRELYLNAKKESSAQAAGSTRAPGVEEVKHQIKKMPFNLRCPQLDVLANLLFHFLDVEQFEKHWLGRVSGVEASSDERLLEDLSDTIRDFTTGV